MTTNHDALHEALAYELNLVLTDKETKLSPGADRAIGWCLQALAASKPEPQAKSCQAVGPGIVRCENRHQCWEPCGELGKSEEHAKVYEPQAQAGEPEVVRELCAKCNGTGFVWQRDAYSQFEPKPCQECGETGRVTVHADAGLVVGAVSWPSQSGACPNVVWEHTPPSVVHGDQLITLQSHREAMAETEEMNRQLREQNEAVDAACAELEQAIAKKDAALQACVEALKEAKTEFKNTVQYLKPDSKPEIWVVECLPQLDAAITQAQKALK